MNQERWTVPTQSKQKETSSVFPFSLICCLMSALADVSAPQAGSIFLPSADSSACCYVFCLHSKFPDCLSQMITSLAGPVLYFKTLPKAEAFQVCTHQQRELPEREHGCVAPWKGPPRCPRPPAYVPAQAQTAGLKHCVCSVPWIPARRERQHRQKNSL